MRSQHFEPLRLSRPISRYKPGIRIQCRCRLLAAHITPQLSLVPCGAGQDPACRERQAKIHPGYRASSCLQPWVAYWPLIQRGCPLSIGNLASVNIQDFDFKHWDRLLLMSNHSVLLRVRRRPKKSESKSARGNNPSCGLRQQDKETFKPKSSTPSSVLLGHGSAPLNRPGGRTVEVQMPRHCLRG